MPENIQNALFGLFLLAGTIFLYRAKIEYQEPKGVCLTAWRIAAFGFGLVFSTVSVLAYLGDVAQSSLRLAPLGIGAFSALAGILLALTNGCGKAKQ